MQQVTDNSKISVIMPTRNRADVIPLALKAIDEAAEGFRVEVIVVDNGSSDDTKVVVESFEHRHIDIAYLFQATGGVSFCKNVGIKSSSGDILVYTDDDCRIAPDYFKALIAHYKNDSGPVIRGGRVELGDPDDAQITVKTDTDPAVLGGDQHPGGFVHGCNLTMSRSVIMRIGPWDESFGPGAPFKAAEETELNYRAHKAGIPVRYEPDLVTHHYHGRRGLASINSLSRSYQHGNGALYAKHADKLLTKHLYWNGRNWFKEWFGGKLFDETLGISHGLLFRGQVMGALAYCAHSMQRRR